MPPTLLYKLINNLKKMKEESSSIKQRPSRGLRGNSFASSQSHQRSILLNKIKDQQNYLCLTNTLLRLAKEAGVPEDSLRLIGQSLLTARGYQSSKMLVDANQLEESLKKRRETYNWLDRGMSLEQEQALLTKVERELVKARETQSHYRCLVKYKSEKQDQIAPNSSSSPGSRKQRFKRMMKERMGVRTVQSSNFYEFEAQQILQNSFKYENECYKTIGSFSHLKTMFGHASDSDIQSFSQIFNAILDKNQNFIITAGEEGLIKIWHRMSGALITNLKGHTEYLNKIDTSYSNKYLLTAGGDGLRFFDLRSLKPLGGWRVQSSIQEISSFIEKDRELFLFGDHSSLYVLTEQTLLSKAESRLEIDDFYRFYFGDMIGRDNSPILVISLSPQETHLILGLQSGQLIMVLVSDLLVAIQMNKTGQQLTLPCLLTVKAHSEQIIQAKWSNNSHIWATGAKDGRCCLWQLKGDQIHLLTTLTVGSKSNKGRRKKYNFTCTYICWNCTFSHFAAGFQQNVEDEDSDRGHGEVLVYSLKERRVTIQLSKDVSQQYGGIRAMDAHPYYPNILLICQAQGNILLFDIFLGCVINVFQQRGYHILHPNFQLIPTECRFSKNGLSFIVASQYGSISIYGYDSKIFYTMTPTEQFLKTDFQPIKIQDNSMRALPLSLQFQEDINNYPRGDILNIRGQKHNNAISVNAQNLIYKINQPLPIYQHFSQSKLDPSFLKIIAKNIKESQTQQQIYSKTFDQIERLKQLVLFHQRQRQFLIVQTHINEKIRQLKVTKQGMQMIEKGKFGGLQEEEQPIIRSKLKRLSQRNRVNYADDIQLDQSKEEDYDGVDDFNQQQIPQELPDSYFDGQEDQQQQAPRVRRRQTRNRRITRVTRQSNNNSRIYNYEINDEDFGEQKITRKRRRDYTDQLDEIESQHVPKKKTKIEQESSQNRTYARLRKHVDEDQIVEESVKECYRCQINKATQFCSNCEYTQQYCQECAQLRGRRIKDKYHCIICLYLKNRAEQEHQYVTQQFYRATTKNQQIYIPQIDEKVRFFFQGYEDFLVQNVSKLNTNVYKKNQCFRLLPHTEDPNLVNTPLCKVVSIDYCFPMKCSQPSTMKRTPGKGEKLAILMLLGLKPVEEGETFWIFYIPGYEFLLLEHVYAQIKQKELISRMMVNQLITLKDQQLQIVELGPTQDRFPESLWKLVKIRKTEGKRLRANTKQVQRRVNIWKLSQEIQKLSTQSNLNQKQVERLIEQLKIWRDQTDSYFCIFQEYVEFEIYPKYRFEIPVGICLKTILARLQNNYYSNAHSLEIDIKLIYQNSLRFNGLPTVHQVTKKAEELTNILMNLLHNEENPIPSSAKATQEDSTNKKEKVMKQHEEFQQSFSNQYETRRKTRRQEQKIMKKRKEESSDYEQDQISQQHFIDFQLAGVSTRNRNRGGNRQTRHQNQVKRITRSTQRY